MSAAEERSAREIAMGQVQPSGRVNRDELGLELIVSRRFPASGRRGVGMGRASPRR